MCVRDSFVNITYVNIYRFLLISSEILYTNELIGSDWNIALLALFGCHYKRRKDNKKNDQKHQQHHQQQVFNLDKNKTQSSFSNNLSNRSISSISRASVWKTSTQWSDDGYFLMFVCIMPLSLTAFDGKSWYELSSIETLPCIHRLVNCVRPNLYTYCQRINELLSD